MAAATVWGVRTPVGAGTLQAEILDFGFLPDEMAVTVGDNVIWKNTGAASHTVTADDRSQDHFDSGRVVSGAEFAHVFEKTGTFSYHCKIHPSMQGVVRVAPMGTTTTTSPPETTTTTVTAPPPTSATTAPATTTTVVPGNATAPQGGAVEPQSPVPSPTAGAAEGRVPADIRPPATPSPEGPTSAPVPVGEFTKTSATNPSAVSEPSGPDPSPDQPAVESEVASGGEPPPARNPEERVALVGLALVAIGGVWFVWQLRPRRHDAGPDTW
jgi:plastocyanin